MKARHGWSIASIALLAAVGTPARAQETISSDQIVVTGSREPTVASRQPYSVSVLDATSLATSESIADAVARLPEAYVQMPGGRTGFASLFLRGADPNFTTVFLEGVPLDSPTNSRGGAVNLASISSATFEQVEVLSGPASSLYGSGSLAGALNLLLKPPTAHHEASVRGMVGTDGEHVALGRWTGPLMGDLGMSLAAVFDDAGTGESQSRFQSTSFDLKIGRPGSRKNGLFVHFADTRSRQFPDSSGGSLLAEIRDVERRFSMEQLVAIDQPVAVHGPVHFSIAGSYFAREDRVISPGVASSPLAAFGVPAGRENVNFRRFIVRPTASANLGRSVVSLGAQGQWERARSEGEIDLGGLLPTSFRRARQTLSAFAEFASSRDRWEMNASFRYDDTEASGSRWTGRAGLRGFIGTQISVRGSIGTAFKVPSFYALANPFIGNPDLRPESATSGELGVEWKDGNNRISVTYFRATYRDLIDFLPEQPPRLANRARVNSEGLLATVLVRVNRNLSGSLGLQHAMTKDAATDTDLLNRPRWRFTSELNWSNGSDLTFVTRFIFTGRRHDFSIPTGILTLEATERAMAALTWDASPKVQVSLVAENLLDDRDQDAIGFTAASRRARISLTRNFN